MWSIFFWTNIIPRRPNLTIWSMSQFTAKQQLKIKSLIVSRSLMVDFILFPPFILFFFYFYFYFSFSIFRTAQVRVDWSCCHISHKLIAKSQDWSRDLGELSRRFKNKRRHITWKPHVDLMDYTWLFRVGCTVESTDHL